MSLQNLTKEEKLIVFNCLQAVAYTQFIEDTVFHTLMGIHRDNLKQVINNWDSVDESILDVKLALNNSMNNLISLKTDEYEVWNKYISVSHEEVERVFYKWRGEPVPPPEKWDGIVRGAITRSAQDQWNKIDDKTQNLLLTKVWCPYCSEYTTITRFEGFNDKETKNLILSGCCVKCFGHIELIIDRKMLNKVNDNNAHIFLKRDIWS